MTITSATSAPSASTSPSAANSTLPQKTLGQADFLKLLTVQLQQQDPMKPMDDTAFVAQMAQFTSLQQTSDMATQITALKANSALQTATNLIGSDVTLLTANGTVTGQVQAVDNSTTAVQLNVDGILYPLTQVVGIAPPSASLAQ